MAFNLGVELRAGIYEAISCTDYILVPSCIIKDYLFIAIYSFFEVDTKNSLNIDGFHGDLFLRIYMAVDLHRFFMHHLNELNSSR